VAPDSVRRRPKTPISTPHRPATRRCRSPAVITEEVPEVPDDRRVMSERLREGFSRVQAHYGFMEWPDVQHVVAKCGEDGINPDETTYYLGRANLLPIGSAPMVRWRKRLFALLSRNASSATDFFGIPPDRVVELGARIRF
jgi:KUP system potassium uptake protein